MNDADKRDADLESRRKAYVTSILNYQNWMGRILAVALLIGLVIYLLRR